MIIVQLKCQMCGHHFEGNLLDRDDPKERDIVGSPVRCPRCNSQRVETIRRVRRAWLDSRELVFVGQNALAVNTTRWFT